MKMKAKKFIAIPLLAIVCAGILWHIQTWQNSGRYADMATFIGTPKAVIKVIYDIGIMILSAGTFGLFYSKIIDTISKK